MYISARVGEEMYVQQKNIEAIHVGTTCLILKKTLNNPMCMKVIKFYIFYTYISYEYFILTLV